MQRDPRAFLWDVQQAAEAITQFTAGLDVAGYRTNPMIRSAVERQFEIIGEALNRLSKETPDLAKRVPDLGQIRVTRLVGAFAAGRVINPRLVRSQIFGGMIWGMSFALHEEAIMDRRSGRTLNANLAEYHVPVNADVPVMEALMIDEHDPNVNVLGIKGVGEIGITGSAGAVANAVWHATGIRVRRFPIRIDDLVTPASN